MALKNKSLFLFNLKIDTTNNSIDFRAVASGTILQATLTKGYYNLDALLIEIKRAMQSVDPTRIYTITVDRTISGGSSNRVTITTNGTHLELLFATGPRFASSAGSLLGFPIADQVGNLTYTGTSSCGTILIPTYIGYNYLPQQAFQKVFGSVNVSASGAKEAVVYNIQKFIQVEFRYESEARMLNEWSSFWSWVIQQKSFEFTPEITSPTLYYAVTLESSSSDSKGLGYKMTEMLPSFPFMYTTGNILMRIKQ